MTDHNADEPTAPWVPIEEYTPEALQACEKALRTIISRIGVWGPRLVLFGGLAPQYIVDSPPSEVGEHTGTTDLDVVVGVEIEVGDEGVSRHELAWRSDSSPAWTRMARSTASGRGRCSVATRKYDRAK